MIQIIDTILVGLSYINILLLLFGMIFLIRKQRLYILMIYFALLIIFEVLSLWEMNSIWLLPTSSYVHVFCLYFYFLIYYLKKKWNIVLTGLSILLLLVGYELYQGYSKFNFEPFSYLFYDFCIVLLMLFLLYKHLQPETKKRLPLSLIFFTLTYFTVDFIVAVTSNYLINEQVHLVGWVWLFRAVCLTVFYFSIVKFSVR